MINVLVVDDDDNKRAKIIASLKRSLPGDGDRCDEARFAIEAARFMKETKYDLLILDINLPMRAGDRPDPRSGEELLRQVQLKRFLVPTHVIGLTAFADVLDRYSGTFEEFTWSVVLYEQSSDGWERRIANKVEHIIAGKEIEDDVRYECDIAIITAVEDVEMREVMALDAGWKRIQVAGDDTAYFSGSFVRGSKSLKVVSAAAIQMGMPAATGLAMKMCAVFKPRYLSMVGIAAGVKGGFGDILIADKAWDYGSGKTRAVAADAAGSRRGDEGGVSLAVPAAVFEPAPTAIPLDPELVAKLGVFRRDDDVLRQIEASWRGARPPKNLESLVGGVASGAAVVENRPLIDMIRSQERKLIGIDMEAYGVFLAARVCPAPRPKALVMKSVCDFGDSNKGDSWQKYAAFTSARFLYEFALAEL